MQATVYAVRCVDYAAVEAQLPQLLARMGGLEQFVRPNEKIILKPNLLTGAAPEQAVTVHPAVIVTLGRLVQALGAHPVLADSPGSGYAHTRATLNKTYQACGLLSAAAAAGLELNQDLTYETVSYPAGRLVKRFEVMMPVLHADGLLNVCKLKTHAYVGMSGAVKNLFGVIPGRAKVTYHATLNNPVRFAQMLLDLVTYLKPRLSLMDAVVGMEGDGPCAGTPRPVGYLLAAENPLALDVVAGAVLGLPRAANVVLVEADKRGLGPTRLEEVQVVGAELAELRQPGYKLPVTFLTGGGWGKSAGMPWWQVQIMPFIEPLLKHHLAIQPRIDPARCSGCGICRNACPTQAITLVAPARPSQQARIDSHACIRCYCCHEMCPQKAVRLDQRLLHRIFKL